MQEGVEDASDPCAVDGDVASEVDASEDRDPEMTLGPIVGQLHLGMFKEDAELCPLSMQVGEGLTECAAGADGGVEDEMTELVEQGP